MVPSEEALCWLTKGPTVAQKVLGLERIFELEVTGQAQ